MVKLKNISTKGLFVFIFLTLVFTRSFVGLTLFGFRLGEYIVLFGFLLTPIICFKFYIEKFNKKYLIFVIIYLYFFMQLLFTNANLLDSYVFKASSFIGITTYYFVGILFSYEKHSVLSITKFLPLLLPFAYMFGSSRYPKIIGEYFLNYSDKFEFIKAADVLILIVIVIFYYNHILNSKYKYFLLFFVIPLFLPELLYLSRGSFVGLTLFFVMEIISNWKLFSKNIFKTIVYLVFSILVFIISTLNIYGNLNFEKNNPLMNAELQVSQTQVLQENLQDLIKRRNYIGVIFSLYFDDGILKSTDGTLNWRLDIWQDLLKDMKNENKIFFGYGYNEILPVMTDPSEPGRMGSDGMNENIHNYFLNVLARGGFFLLILFIYLHIYFVLQWKKKFNNYKILNYIIPLLVAASFDVAMEGVQFPLNYYFFIGVFLSKKN